MSEEYIDFTKQIEFLKNKITKIKNYKNLEYLFLGSIMIFAFYIRTLNLKLLQGKYLLGLDPYYYLRQATEILAEGKLPFPDMMRNAPFGIEKGFDLFPYFLAYFSKFMNLFGLSVIEAHIIYPPLFMILSLIPLYFLIKLIFDKKVALLSVLILSILPAYIFRTMSGFSDHESVAMFLIFCSFYFLIKGEKTKSNNSKYYFLAGFFAFLMSISWSAYPFLFIIIGTYFFLKNFFSNVNLRSYLIFLISLIIPFTITKGLLLSDLGILYLVFVTVFLITSKYSNLETRINIPNQVIVLTIIGILVLFILAISDSFSFSEIINKLLNAGGTSKVDFTTSEALPAKVMLGNGYYGQFNEFIFLSYFGFILLIYRLFSKLSKKERIVLTSIFSISIGLIMFGNWNNKIIIMENTYIHFLIANAILFLIYYSEIFRKKNHHHINNLVNPEILIFISYFLVTGLLARTAVRFLFLMSPIVAILSAYFIIQVYSKLRNERIYSIGLIILTLILLNNSINQSIDMSERMGSSFPGQWESSMNWINENTPEDSIITHWWDYGYWTQYYADRATVSDGGRAGGDLGLYTLARYGMLGSDDKETMEYFKSRNVNYLLFSEEEIGKYGAFSYIGSNINKDKYTTLGIMGLNSINEIRDGNKLNYAGNWIYDSELIEGNKIINANTAKINKISFNINTEGNKISDGILALSTNNFQKDYDLGCIYMNGEKILDDYSELDVCVTILPTFNGENKNDFGSIMIQSKRAYEGLFSKLYIHDQKIEGYTLVYSDNTPLGLFNGRIVGPIKIWKINYSGNENNLERFTDISKYMETYPDNGIYSI